MLKGDRTSKNRGQNGLAIGDLLNPLIGLRDPVGHRGWIHIPVDIGEMDPDHECVLFTNG